MKDFTPESLFIQSSTQVRFAKALSAAACCNCRLSEFVFDVIFVFGVWIPRLAGDVPFGVLLER
jgi:hypothetical protein